MGRGDDLVFEPSDDTIANFNAFRADYGLRPVGRRGGRKKIRSFSISDEALEGLKYLATALETTFGDTVSVSALLERIGTFDFAVVKKESLKEGAPGEEARRREETAEVERGQDER